MKSVIFFVSVLFFSLNNAHAFMDGSMTGGMSQVYLDDTIVRVDGGFIEWIDEKDISIRAKGLEVAINVDNSLSKEDKAFNFSVTNINPEKTSIIGGEEGIYEKGINSLTFPIHVKASKVVVLKLFPDKIEEDISFIVFGESRGGENVFKRILGDINYRKPLFVVSCGDMVESGEEKSFEKFREDIDDVGIPFFTVAGSSEVEGGRNVYEDYLGKPYYSFDFKQNHFIILDNGDARIGESQFEWLENDLMNNKALNTFVFMHLPPYDPRPGRVSLLGRGGQHRRLAGLFEKHKVKRVFTSGIHGYFKDEIGGVQYVISGGGGSELEMNDANYNYVIVQVSGDKVNDKLIKLTVPPAPLLESIVKKSKLYIVNSFHSHPFRTIFYALIAFFFLFLFVALLKSMLIRGKKKKRLSF